MSTRKQPNKASGNQTISRSSNNPTKSQRKDTMARKREERAARNAHRKQKQAQGYLADDEAFVSFANQLAKAGLELRDIPGDGNCLFRALGDQLEGHSRNHLKYRRDVVKFMRENRTDFEPFVEDDVPFDRHIKNLNEVGTYAGNDAIVAFARLHQIHVVIHQVNSPCWQIHGTENPAGKELHISYHNGDHYSSIRKIGDATETPANIRMSANDLLEKPAETNTKTKTKKCYVENSWNDTGAYNDENTYNENYPEDYVENGGGGGEDTIQTIMRITGCEDPEVVQTALENVGHNEETAIEHVIHLMSTTLEPNHSEEQHSSSACGGIWDNDGTGARIFGGMVNGDSQRSHDSHNMSNSSGAKPKLRQQGASQTKRVKKLERKIRAAERRRNERLGTTAASSGISSDEDVHVVADSMGTLKI